MTIVALLEPGMCFRPMETKVNLKILRCMQVLDLVLKLCSGINERNGIQLFFLIPCVGGYSCIFEKNRFLSKYGSGSKFSFPSSTFVLESLQMVSKNGLITIGLNIGCFCWKKPYFVFLKSAVFDMCRKTSSVSLF